MNRLDVSPWNLGLPLTMLVACGPVVPIDDTGTDTEIDPTADPSSVSDPSDPTVPSTTTTPGCPEGCAPGYYCVGSSCIPYSNDDDYCIDGGCCYYDTGGCCYGGGEFGGCCYGDTDCGYYDCSTLADCYGSSYCADFGDCQPAATPPACELSKTLEQRIPALPAGFVVALSFVETDGDPARELAVATDAGAAVTAVELAAATALPLAQGALDVGTGDVDGDGDADVVVATAAGQLAVFVNDGTGVLTAAQSYDTSALRIDVADMDGDGVPDFVGLLDLGTPTPQLAILRGLGGGAFDPPYVHAPNGPTYDYEVAELFGDAGVELAAFDGNSTFAWHGGPLDGTSDFISGNVGELPGALALGDFDGDGLGDIAQVVPHGNYTIVDVYHDIGGSFERSATQQLYGYFDRAEAADVDADGRADLVVAGSDGIFAVMFGTVWDFPAPFGCVQTYDSFVGGPVVLALGDYDGDGGADVALSDGVSTVVHVQSQGG